MPEASRLRTVAAMRSVSTLSGGVVAAAGFSMLCVGLWARRTVSRTLDRERIVSTPDARPPSTRVTTGAAARSLAEVIRRNALEAAGGRTYAETDAFVDDEGRPTSDHHAALKDERTGQPVENPEHALWLQATTLETALMQAYLAASLAQLTIALGGTLVVTGVGLAAKGAGRP